MVQDRVMTANRLAGASVGIGAYLQVGAGTRGASPSGLHVLVPATPILGGDREPVLCWTRNSA